MFRLLDLVDTTAFFVRTQAPLFAPDGDGWWLQQYNKRRFPIGPKPPLMSRLRSTTSRWLPRPLKNSIKQLTRRH
jgi:hypothetical protein